MKHYCVISHTHWDREWYLTQEQFRLKLVDLMDHLLDLLSAEPEYVFHLDAQTIVLEDYWNIKPENKDLCKRFIREGRLLVGPWYVQNDFLLTSGEATVRNLLLGRKQASEAGKCDSIGYTPDQFGMISQLPQILQGFGIDNCVFGRGYRDFYVDENGEVKENQLPAELIWRSPDGSEVFAVCMSFWYNNAQRFSADIDRAVRLVRWQDEHFRGIAATPYLLLMNGVDHLEAQADLLPILANIQKYLAPDEQIYQTTFDHYLQQVREHLKNKEMYVWNGEMVTGLDPQVLKDCSSSRVYIKTKNSYLQNLLANQLEPLYAMLEQLGMDGCYPSGHLDYQWKMLMRNHAHDSICCCSKDAVVDHVEDRLLAVEEAGKGLLTRGMDLLSAHIDRSWMKEDDYLITVFNPLEKMRSEIVEVDVDVLTTDQPTGLRIWDANGRRVPFTLLKYSKVNRRMLSAVNLPGFREVERYRIRMMAEDVPAFGYKAYRVQTNADEMHQISKEECSVMENRHLRVQVYENGMVDILHKTSGHCYRDVLSFEDRADVGHSYISIAMPNDIPVRPSANPKILSAETDGQRQIIKLEYAWDLPVGLNSEKTQRSVESVVCPMVVQLTLDRDSSRLDVDVTLQNNAKDHRLLALIQTGLASDETIALSPYDLVKHHKRDIDTKICNESRHNSGLVSIYEGELGMSILNLGIYSYENLQRENGTISLTLMRSTGRVWPQDSEGYPEDDSWEAPGNQCLRTVHHAFSIYPHCKQECDNSLFASKAFQNPLLVHSSPVDTRKFLGGRPALQDANIDENFYLPDPYPTVALPGQSGAWELEGDNIQVTAWKKTFDRSAYVLRFFNGNEESQTVKLLIKDICISRIWKSDLQEVARESVCFADGVAEIPVRGKEITTLIME